MSYTVKFIYHENKNTESTFETWTSDTVSQQDALEDFCDKHAEDIAAGNIDVNSLCIT